ncbi:MAG: 6,7-dimethyl-8-ribityllumazine synthase [Candidatus Marinimicrobia bacterium]|nr:6,7-dimethyl-8-ribityllumazine synthase [Candidatus Neomarinimicrobiota bacterium]
MSTFIKKKLNSKNYKIAIIVAEFNPLISEQLRLGAIDAFYFLGGIKSNIQCYYVPGAFEIPGCVQQIINNKNVDAIITLGAVIKGGTPHFDFVAGETANKISLLSTQSSIPVLFGVLTTDTLQQALERAGTKALNKGWEIMEATISTIQTYYQIKEK